MHYHLRFHTAGLMASYDTIICASLSCLLPVLRLAEVEMACICVYRQKAVFPTSSLWPGWRHGLSIGSVTLWPGFPHKKRFISRRAGAAPDNWRLWFLRGLSLDDLIAVHHTECACRTLLLDGIYA